MSSKCRCTAHSLYLKCVRMSRDYVLVVASCQLSTHGDRLFFSLYYLFSLYQNELSRLRVYYSIGQLC